MQENRVGETYHLDIGQCGNQLAYGLPWSEYCSRRKAPGKEWCQECCDDIRDNYPGTDAKRRSETVELLTVRPRDKSEVFVWPQRGGDTDPQRGRVFVFKTQSDFAKQLALGMNSFVPAGADAMWKDSFNPYLDETYRSRDRNFHGRPYDMENLMELVEIYDDTRWQEQGELFEDAGDMGGDVQVGKAFNRRFINPDLPGRLVTVNVYPIAGDGNNEPDLSEVDIECQVEYMICEDMDDPGGTEVWSDIKYDRDIDVLVSDSIEKAESAAKNYVKRFLPEHIAWDGEPFA